MNKNSGLIFLSNFWLAIWISWYVLQLGIILELVIERYLSPIQPSPCTWFIMRLSQIFNSSTILLGTFQGLWWLYLALLLTNAPKYQLFTRYVYHIVLYLLIYWLATRLVSLFYLYGCQRIISWWMFPSAGYAIKPSGRSASEEILSFVPALYAELCLFYLREEDAINRQCGCDRRQHEQLVEANLQYLR